MASTFQYQVRFLCKHNFKNHQKVRNRKLDAPPNFYFLTNFYIGLNVAKIDKVVHHDCSKFIHSLNWRFLELLEKLAVQGPAVICHYCIPTAMIPCMGTL